MAVPTYEEFMRPVLELLDEHGQLSARDLRARVADRCNLSEEDREVTIDSGASRYGNRVNWAVTYLVQAGAIHRPRRATAEIADWGRKLLAAHDGPITKATLTQFPEFIEFTRRKRPSNDPTETVARPVDPSVPATFADARRGYRASARRRPQRAQVRAARTLGQLGPPRL